MDSLAERGRAEAGKAVAPPGGGRPPEAARHVGLRVAGRGRRMALGMAGRLYFICKLLRVGARPRTPGTRGMPPAWPAEQSNLAFDNNKKDEQKRVVLLSRVRAPRARLEPGIFR